MRRPSRIAAPHPNRARASYLLPIIRQHRRRGEPTDAAPDDHDVRVIASRHRPRARASSRLAPSPRERSTFHRRRAMCAHAFHLARASVPRAGRRRRAQGARERRGKHPRFGTLCPRDDDRIPRRSRSAFRSARRRRPRVSPLEQTLTHFLLHLSRARDDEFLRRTSGVRGERARADASAPSRGAIDDGARCANDPRRERRRCSPRARNETSSRAHDGDF